MRRAVGSVAGWVGIVVACIAVDDVVTAVWGWDTEWFFGYLAGSLAASWLARGAIPWQRAERIRAAIDEQALILDRIEQRNKEVGGHA